MRTAERLVIWFSCGATSAVAARMALDKYSDSGLEVVMAYCDTGAEHPDNARFMRDCEAWLGHPIQVLRHPHYVDTWGVWEARRYIAGVYGAPCTLELKKSVRERFERPDTDLQVFGFDAGEVERAAKFRRNQPEVQLVTPLIDAGLTKEHCFLMLQEAGIALPAMYQLGYRNNNCIGCPKGNAGYWNKIRVDFPEVFQRMASLEREVGARICQATIGGVRQRVHLDELPLTAGHYPSEAPITCGLLCDDGKPASHGAGASG